MPKVKIDSISLVKSEKIQDGGSFRINEGEKDAMWLNLGFIRNFYTNKGLAANTSFQMLVGCTVKWEELTVTEEMLAAGGGQHVVPNPLGGADIVFKQKGLKQYGHSMGRLSDKLEDAIFNSGVTFDSSWANLGRQNTTRPAIATAPINGDKPSGTEEPEHTDDTLNAEAPGTPVQTGATVPADNQEIPA